MRVTAWPTVVYAAAALAIPAVAYAAQPAACFWYLYWPYVLTMLAVLCLAAAVAQPFVLLPPHARLVASVVFAGAIQATVLVPCISSTEESARVIRISTATLVLGWLAACALLFVSAGLFRSGPLRTARTIAATGFAVAAGSLAIGASKQYLGITGMISVPFPEAFAELHVPRLLMVAVGTCVVGVVAATVQGRHRAVERGAV